MRLALVTNIASGRRNRAADVADVLRAAGADVSVHAFEPGAADAVARAADAPAAERPDRRAVAGGDGSIGPVAARAAAAGLPLAIVPTGTANDFARFIDLPLDVEAAPRPPPGCRAALPHRRDGDAGAPGRRDARRRPPVRQRGERRAVGHRRASRAP